MPWEGFPRRDLSGGGGGRTWFPFLFPIRGPNPGLLSGVCWLVPADSEQMRERGRGPCAAPVLSWLWLPLVPSHQNYLLLVRAPHG